MSADEFDVYDIDTDTPEGGVRVTDEDPLPEWITDQCIHDPRCTVELDCDRLLWEQGDGSW